MTKEEQRIREYVKLTLEEKSFGLRDYWRRFKGFFSSDTAKKAAMVFIEDLKEDAPNEFEISLEAESLINQKAKEYYAIEETDEENEDVIYSQILRRLKIDPDIKGLLSQESKGVVTKYPEKNLSFGEEAIEVAENYIDGLEIYHNVSVSRKTEQEIFRICEKEYPAIRSKLRDKRQATKTMTSILNRKFGVNRKKK